MFPMEPEKGVIKFYCSGCGKEIEELNITNFLSGMVLYDPSTGNVYHNETCKNVDVRNSGNITVEVKYNGLVKLLEKDGD